MSLRLMENVVGGHGAKADKGPPMMVKGDKLYKPTQGASSLSGTATESRGLIEANFYKTMFDDKHPMHKFMPKFYGQERDGNIDYLVLENALNGYDKPCVLDLKMGTQTYSEDATPEKIAREEKKYPPQRTLGFRFVGMKVWQTRNAQYMKVERDWCMNINEQTVGKGLEKFFDNGSGSLRKDVVDAVILQIKQIKEVLEDHAVVRLYGSSLLILYEGNTIGSTKSPVVKMIDFAHPYKITDSGVDEGYITGCETILRELSKM
eukprot:CFRG3535T1